MFYYINLKTKGLFTFLSHWNVGELFASIGLITFSVQVEGTWKLLEIESSPLNIFQRLFLHWESNRNPTSSKYDTSFFVKLTPCWTSRTIETCDLAMTYFHEDPPTQWLMELGPKCRFISLASRNQLNCKHLFYNYMQLVIIYNYFWDYLQLWD